MSSDQSFISQLNTLFGIELGALCQLIQKTQLADNNSSINIKRVYLHPRRVEMKRLEDGQWIKAFHSIKGNRKTRALPTIGIGFNLDKLGARTHIDSLGLSYEQVIAGNQVLTEEQINTLFLKDLKQSTELVLNVITPMQITQKLGAVRFCLLVDMVFDMLNFYGEPERKHTFEQLNSLHGLLKALQTCNWWEVSYTMMKLHWACRANYGSALGSYKNIRAMRSDAIPYNDITFPNYVRSPGYPPQPIKINIPDEDLKQSLVKSVADYIRPHEGYRKKVYKDSLGYNTIGIGFVLEEHIRPQVEREIEKYTNGRVTLTALLNDDVLLSYVEVVRLFSELSIPEAIQGAKKIFSDFSIYSLTRRIIIVDMVFNLGETKIRNQFIKFTKAVKEQQWNEAAYQMLDSTWRCQVKGRALANANAMRYGILTT